MLSALMDGRALPAGELAAAAGLSASAASTHLSRLVDGGLLAVEYQGRHRYYRLNGSGVAAILEEIASLVGKRSGHAPVQTSQTRALRKARTCYDHLAGELGVAIAEALDARGFLAPAEGKCLSVTSSGSVWFATALAIDVAELKPGRQGIACRCLDWTERRYHLAGPLGSAILRRCCDRGMLIRLPRSRKVRLTVRGRRFLGTQLGLDFAVG